MIANIRLNIAAIKENINIFLTIFSPFATIF
jgi:hypothetical protein